MNQQALWILTTVSEYRMPISLLSAVNRGEIFNLPELGFSWDTLVNLLETLISNHELDVRRIDYVTNQEAGVRHESEPFEPNRSQIESLLKEERRFGVYSTYYGLTDLGGRRWEREAKPDWSRYVASSFDPAAGDADITATDRNVADRYLEAWPYLWREYGIESASIVWEELRPWQATYWKQLPVGNMVTFLAKRLEPEPEFAELPTWVREVLHVSSAWYSAPFSTWSSGPREPR